MYVFKDLQSLLDVSVKWEKELKDLYDVAELGVKHPKSKKLITFLLTKQGKILEVLEDIDVAKFGADDFIQYTRENHTERLIPVHEMNKNSEPDEIIKLIKLYESKLKDYYGEIADHLPNDGKKDLFESLVTLKNAQLEALDNFIREQINQAV